MNRRRTSFLHRQFPGRGAVHVFAVLLGVLLVSLSAFAATAADMHVFYGEGCRHCRDQHLFLEDLQRTYPELTVHRHEVWRSQIHHPLFREMAARHGIEASSVPTVFFDGHVWEGHSTRIAEQIEAAVRRRLGEGKSPSAERIGPPLATDGARTISIPGAGGIALRGDALIYSTVLIAFVDGFNPCSFWVLTLLLGLVIHSGSRQRVLVVGITFLLTTTVVYGVFIAGMFSVLSYVLYLNWVQWLVAAFALVFGLVNIKDYFWYQRGISFTISDQRKPGIYRSMRRVVASGDSLLAPVTATVVMAAGIALVELPCTAGFPVLWTALLADQQVAGTAFLALLALYLAVYLLDELAVFAVAAATLRIGRFQERHGRLLKLIGGMIMLALAVTLVWNPELMNQLGSSLLVFGTALAAALAIHALAAGSKARGSR